MSALLSWNSMEDNIALNKCETRTEPKICNNGAIGFYGFGTMKY